MVSNFVDEVSGYVHSPTEAALILLEVQKEGYFNNEILLKHVETTTNSFEEIHPNACGAVSSSLTMPHDIGKWQKMH